MKISKQLQKKVSNLISLSFDEGRVIEIQVTRSIKELKSLPAHQSLPALLEYLSMFKRKEREHTMYIESTVSLSPSQVKDIKKIAERKVKITKVIVNINPQLLAGFKLKVGDDVWDESIVGKVMQIKEAIIK